MILRALLFVLLASTACSHQTAGSAPVRLQEPAKEAKGPAGSMTSTSPACLALKEKLSVAHRDASSTPQWKALADSEAWRHHKDCMRAVVACRGQKTACKREHEDFDASWEAVESTAAFHAARDTPQAKQLFELLAEAVQQKCWD